MYVYNMTAADPNQALTQSIGEHAVQAIGRSHISELTVVLSSIDMTCRVVVALEKNTDKEQRRALNKLFDVQELFFDEVAMSFDFGIEDDLPSAQLSSQRQYSFA